MKAMVWTNYGAPDVLQLKDVAKPTPKDNEILIKIHAATVTMGDCEMRSLKFPFWLALPLRLYIGARKPMRVLTPGQELAGVVEAVGKNVTQFKRGDAIFGSTGFHFSAYAEYTCLSVAPDDSALALKPANMTFEEAATVPTGGLEALHFLRHANIPRGQKVLINGAGGSIGTYGVQLAKYYGAHVTAVDSAAKLDMLRSIGADRVIDYAREDFTRSADTYDIIFDIIGKSHFDRALKSLNPNGQYLIANPAFSTLFRPKTAPDGKRIFSTAAERTSADLLFLKELIEAGVIKAIIDKRYPLEQAADAHRYVDAGHKKGNVVITVAS